MKKKTQEYVVQFPFATMPESINKDSNGRRLTSPFKAKNFEILKNAIKSLPSRSSRIKRILVTHSFVHTIGDYLMPLNISQEGKFIPLTLNKKIKFIEDKLSTISQNGIKTRFENGKVKIECDDLRCSSDQNNLGMIILEVILSRLDSKLISLIPTELPESDINRATYMATHSFSDEEVNAINKMTIDGSREYFVSKINKNINEAEKKYNKSENDRGIKFLIRKEFAKSFNIMEAKNAKSKNKTKVEKS